MILVSAAIWGSTYTFSKFAMQQIPVQLLLAVRTLGGAIALGIVCRHRIQQRLTKRMLVVGAGVSISYYVAFLSQMKGLTLIDPGRSAFLTALYCVIIPFLRWAVRKRAPGLQHIFAAGMCVAGVGCISLNAGTAVSSSQTVLGDVLTIFSAFAFAVYFYSISVLSISYDPLVLTFIIFMDSGVLFAVGSVFTEQFPSWNAIDASTYGCVLYLLAAALAAQVMQNLGIAHTPALQASVLLCTETLFALIISMIFYSEHPGVKDLVGFLFIFLAILCSELAGRR